MLGLKREPRPWRKSWNVNLHFLVWPRAQEVTGKLFQWASYPEPILQKTSSTNILANIYQAKFAEKKKDVISTVQYANIDNHILIYDCWQKIQEKCENVVCLKSAKAFLFPMLHCVDKEGSRRRESVFKHWSGQRRSEKVEWDVIKQNCFFNIINIKIETLSYLLLRSLPFFLLYPTFKAHHSNIASISINDLISCQCQ